MNPRFDFSETIGPDSAVAAASAFCTAMLLLALWRSWPRGWMTRIAIILGLAYLIVEAIMASFDPPGPTMTPHRMLGFIAIALAALAASRSRRRSA